MEYSVTTGKADFAVVRIRNPADGTVVPIQYYTEMINNY